MTLEQAVYIDVIRRLCAKRDATEDGKVRWVYDRIIAELWRELRK